MNTPSEIYRDRVRHAAASTDGSPQFLGKDRRREPRAHDPAAGRAAGQVQLPAGLESLAVAQAREGLRAGDVSRRLGQFFDLGGIGFARGALSFSPRPLNFGNRPVFGTSGPSPIETVTLGNPSGVPILVGNITTSSNFQIVNPHACTTMLSPGQNCALRIKFAPDAVGPYRGMLTITDNSTSSPQTIALVGVGVPGTLSFAPTPLGFGKIKVGAASAPKPLKMTNVTGAVASVMSVVASSTAFVTSNDRLSLRKSRRDRAGLHICRAF
jgi:hypothetical protein